MTWVLKNMKSSPLASFHYKALGNENAPKTIFLLHGTGGTENDLFHFVEPFEKSHTLVGLLGNVRESGMARFFKRSADGILDQESIKLESQKFADFILAFTKAHNQRPEDITYIGYSNGANMILATMFYFPELVKKAVLWHPMLPFVPKEDLDLSAQKVLLSWSALDPIIKSSESLKIIEILKKHRANLSTIETDSGHAIDRAEVLAMHEFISEDSI